MTGLQQQELTGELLPKIRIFVDNDALVFFDVPNPPSKSTDIAKIENEPIKENWDQKHNFLVCEKETHYFRTGQYNALFCTVSVTGSCIVFCGYTTHGDGMIKPSGVYHAESLPPTKTFQKRLYKLIDTVQPVPNGQITLKAVGNDYKGEDLRKLRRDLAKILTAKNVKIQPKHLILGGKSWRVTEFYPQNSQVVTYFDDGKQKLYYKIY